MSNFYGKRFLSALMGALSVLSSPVASAVGGKLGKGNLRGEVGSSAGRSKNGGKGGKLEVNREVKSIDGLKGVLKETGGKVVRVSPDGKGGFVAFVKTPTGKVVTVAIVGVPLLIILGLVSHYVFSGQKNDVTKNVDEIDNPEIVVKNTSKAKVVKGATGKLSSLFDDGDQYNSFVDKLFKSFFNDKSGVLKRKFDKCKGNLDEFLKVVFEVSTFDDSTWSVDEDSAKSSILWSWTWCKVITFTGERLGMPVSGFLGGVLKHLSAERIVTLPEDGIEQADWGDKISALLFGFWSLVKFNSDFSYAAPEQILGAKENLGEFKRIFNIIKSYVEERLNTASKSYKGEELA